MSFWKLILIIKSGGPKNSIQQMLGSGALHTLNKLVSKQGFFGMHEPLLNHLLFQQTLMLLLQMNSAVLYGLLLGHLLSLT